MRTLPLRILLGRVALAALLPLSITACDDDSSSNSSSDGETDTDSDDDDDTTETTPTSVTVTETATETATETMTETATETMTETATETMTDTETSDTENETETETAADTSTGDPPDTDTEGETEDTDGSSSSSSGGNGDCTVVTPDAVFQTEANGANFPFFFNIGDLGVGGADADQFRVEFWGPATGTFDLASAGDNDNYVSCTQCVRVYEDTGDAPTGPQYFGDPQYFQTGGTMEVTASSTPLGGVVELTLTGVTLTEVTVDGGTAVSTPVPDGRCIEIADGTYATPMIDGWDCDPQTYDAGDGCNCGCGLVDPDCTDDTAASCDSCNDNGSCDTTGTGCPGLIDPVDNSICVAVPPAWNCAEAAYGDGTCDCGCGAFDADDCADNSAASCTECNGTGSCDEAGADCSNISDADNSTCLNPLCMDSSTDGTLDDVEGTFNRPNSGVGACTLSPTNGNDAFYEVIDFTAAGGVTNIEASTCDMADFDTFIAVYQAADGSADPFDAANPCDNFVGANDDVFGVCGGNTSLLQLTGLVDGDYQVVVTSYANATTGDFTLGLTCI